MTRLFDLIRDSLADYDLRVVRMAKKRGFGEIDEERRRITIAAQITVLLQASTLLHELIHARFPDWGEPMVWTMEAIVLADMTCAEWRVLIDALEEAAA
jgi:hypothetical protein